MGEADVCVCRKCNLNFTCVSQLRRHTKTVHKNGTPSNSRLNGQSASNPSSSTPSPPTSDPLNPSTDTPVSVTDTLASDTPASATDTPASATGTPASDTPASDTPASATDALASATDTPAISTSPDTTVQSYIASFSKTLETLIQQPKESASEPISRGNRAVYAPQELTMLETTLPSIIGETDLEFKECNFLRQLTGFQCSECGHYFENKDVLHEHLIVEHKKKIKSYHCLYCNHVFFTPQAVLVHIRAVLCSSKPSTVHMVGIQRCCRHRCPVCNEVYPSAYKLRAHIVQNKCGQFQSSFHCDDIKSVKFECMKLILKSYKPKRVISKEAYLKEKEAAAVTPVIKKRPVVQLTRASQTEPSAQRPRTGPHQPDPLQHPSGDDMQHTPECPQYQIPQPVHYIPPEACGSNTFISQLRHPHYSSSYSVESSFIPMYHHQIQHSPIFTSNQDQFSHLLPIPQTTGQLQDLSKSIRIPTGIAPRIQHSNPSHPDPTVSDSQDLAVSQDNNQHVLSQSQVTMQSSYPGHASYSASK